MFIFLDVVGVCVSVKDQLTVEQRNFDWKSTRSTNHCIRWDVTKSKKNWKMGFDWKPTSIACTLWIVRWLYRVYDSHLHPLADHQIDPPSTPKINGLLSYGGFHNHGGTPIAGWFISWNIHPKWMRIGEKYAATCPLDFLSFDFIRSTWPTRISAKWPPLAMLVGLQPHRTSSRYPKSFQKPSYPIVYSYKML